ncbi:MAG: hypothetical protein PHN88_12580 [Ignavibacteria bacterium]|nr:hypothetical protein [Ignavibacteria bacterium]
MYKINLVLLTLVLIFSALSIFSCDVASNSETTYKGTIQGWVYDDSTKAPVYSAKVVSDGISDTIYTDLVGMFKFSNFTMPRGEYNYIITTFKTGYDSCVTYVTAKSDETTKIDSVKLIRAH